MAIRATVDNSGFALSNAYIRIDTFSAMEKRNGFWWQKYIARAYRYSPAEVVTEIAGMSGQPAKTIFDRQEAMKQSVKGWLVAGELQIDPEKPLHAQCYAHLMAQTAGSTPDQV